jgi:TolB-like protein
MLSKKFLSIAAAAFICTTQLHAVQNSSTRGSMEQTNNVAPLYTGISSLAEGLSNTSKIPPNDMGTIAMSTIVNVDNLDYTTTLGRIVSENLMNELFTKGFNVAEYRSMEKLQIKDGGEFYISRQDFNTDFEHQYTLAGTFAVVDKSTVILNARIIDNYTKSIVATANSSFKVDDCALLQTCPKPKEPIRIAITKAAPANYVANNSQKTFRLFQ